MEVLRALGRSPGRTLGYALGAWAGAWGVFYLFQETHRHLELRARQRKHPLQSRDEQNDAAWFGCASEKERTHIMSRFAPLRFCGRYLNVTPEWREQGMWEWMWWKVVHTALYHGRFGWDGGFAQDEQTEEGRKKIESLLPVQPLDSARLWGSGTEPAAPASGITYTWYVCVQRLILRRIGQSTCLVQMHGLTMLTDPVFGKQPLESILSPTRMRPMPCTIDEIRNVDVVLVSHNGVRPEQITELSWWEEAQAAFRVRVQADGGVRSAERTLRVAAVPASHWSARTPLDTNKSLWNSYAVQVQAADEPDARLFFCGDSGYSPSLFQAVGRLYGPFALAAIPIGSYEPRWHLSLQHMDPHGSVCVARDVGARTSFAMHWGTWSMSDERWDDPPKDLAQALQLERLPTAFLRTVPFGATQSVSL